MNVATGLASGRYNSKQLVEKALAAALEKIPTRPLRKIVLFLTNDLRSETESALKAISRQCACMEIAGCTVPGLFTEAGWVLDQPAAAALVIAATEEVTDRNTLLAFNTLNHLPAAQKTGRPRYGMQQPQAQVWSHARLQASSGELTISGYSVSTLRSSGLRPISETFTVDRARGLELQQLAGQPAMQHLRRHLPAELREQPPLHRLYALRTASALPLNILAIRPEGRLLLSEHVVDGESLCWAIRNPLQAASEMEENLSRLSANTARAAFALMFSAFERGPLLFEGKDRNLSAFRKHFPETPLLGAYCSGQIVPTAKGNHVVQQEVITLLFQESNAIQSHS